MSTDSRPSFLHTAIGGLPGLILCTFIAVLALGTSRWPWLAGSGLSALTLAILTGMIPGNTFYPRLQRVCNSGVLFSKQYLLRLGIILYGLRLTLSQITDAGVCGLLIDILTLSSTFALACLVGPRWFGIDRKTTWLIGAGSSICGAAAILATAPVTTAKAEKVTVSIAVVVIFGTLATFIYPTLWRVSNSWFTPDTFGIYIGSTVHEVAQVVAAGHAVSPAAENTAVITKMLRVMMLAPFLLLLATHIKRQPSAGEAVRTPVTVPWFALLFIAVVIINSFHWLPASLVQALISFDTLLLAIAMAALGLDTRIRTIGQAGIRPLLLGLSLFIWLIVGGGAINVIVHNLVS